MPYIHERRTDERFEMDRGLKLFDQRGQRYHPGRTMNVSAGGALVEMRGGEHLTPGQQIKLAVDWAGSARLMHKGQLIGATVIRHDPRHDQSSVVAVKFNQPLSLASAA